MKTTFLAAVLTLCSLIGFVDIGRVAELMADSLASTWVNQYSLVDGENTSTVGIGAIIKLHSGEYVIGTRDSIVKLNASGVPNLQKHFDCFCSIVSMVENPDHGLTIAGGVDFLDRSYIEILKTDVAGNLLWSKRYQKQRFGSVNTIVATNDGGYLIGGSTANLPSRLDERAWLIKIKDNGAIQWQKSYNVARPSSLFQLPNGDFLIGTEAFSVFRLNATGNVKWQKKYSGSNCCSGASMLFFNDGSFVLGGTLTNNQDGTHSSVIVRTNPAGAIVYSNSFVGQEFKDIDFAPGGRFVVLAERFVLSKGRNIIVTTLSSSGGVVWSKLVTTPQIAGPRKIIRIAGGYMFTTAEWIFKVDSDGNIPGLCRSILPPLSTMAKNQPLNVDPKFPNVQGTDALPVTENFTSSNIVAIATPLCSH